MEQTHQELSDSLDHIHNKLLHANLVIEQIKRDIGSENQLDQHPNYYESLQSLSHSYEDFRLIIEIYRNEKYEDRLN